MVLQAETIRCFTLAWHPYLSTIFCCNASISVFCKLSSVCYIGHKEMQSNLSLMVPLVTM